MSNSSTQNIAVLGLGTMGHGIAQTFAAAGCDVRGFDEVEAARDTALDRIRANLRLFVEEDFAAEADVEPALQRVTVCADEGEAVAGAQFVIEAVREDLPTKQELFARVEKLVSPQTILCSNSSSFPMTQIGARLERPQHAVNAHWFNPPHITPLVEVVPGRQTSEATVDQVVALLERAGKMPVRLRAEIPGFLVNRFQIALCREVLDLWQKGIASPQDIDRAVCGSMGMRLAAFGPLQVFDFGGIDIGSKVYGELAPDLCADTEAPAAIRNMVEEGKLGFKTGGGIFEYDPARRDETLADRDRRYVQLAKLFAQRRADAP